MFVNKMNEAEGEAAETQVWLEYAVKCKYMSRDDATRLHKKYDEILRETDKHGKQPRQMGTQNKRITRATSSRFPVFVLLR